MKSLEYSQIEQYISAETNSFYEPTREFVLLILIYRPTRDFITPCNPETHTKRQATQDNCPPSLLGDGDKWIEIVYGEEKHILYWAD